MRKLCWAAFGFALAAFAAEYNILPVKGLPYFAAALFGLTLVFFFVRPLRRYRRTAIFLLFASIASIYWFGHFMLHVLPCEALSGQEITIEARITDFPQETDNYSRLYVRILSGAPREKAVLYLYDEELPEDLQPGDIIRTTVTVGSARYPSSGLSHTNTAVNRNFVGIMSEAPEMTGRAEISWIYFPQYLARAVKKTISQVFPYDVSVFMTALMTGDTTQLYQDTDLYNSLRLAGVMHIVAVSGMHVSIIAWAFAAVFGRRKPGALFTIPILILFVFMSGCRAAVIRAVVMQVFLLIGPLLDQETDSRTSLCAALLFLLLINPMAIGGIGLQLSFCCVAGLIYLSPMLTTLPNVRNKRGRLVGSYLLNGAKTTYCASAFALLPAAYYFHTFSLLSPVSNLLTLPVISICFAAGYILCIIRILCLPLAVFLAKIAAIPVRYCLLVYSAIGKISFSCFYTAQSGVMIIFTLILTLLFFALFTGQAWNRRILCVSGAVILCCVMILLQGARLSRAQGQLAVLDVGQGQCTVLTDGEHTIIIGCGGTGTDNAGDIASDFLLSEGIQQADALILPSSQSDMDNGTEMLLSLINVGAVILPSDHLAEDYSEIASAAAEYDAGFLEISEPVSFSIGNIECTLLYSQNDMELSVLAELAGKRVLIMGDADEVTELEYLSNGYLDDVDYLIVGAYGADNSSSAFFLDSVQPDTAVLSVEIQNTYYPAADTLQRLERSCATLERTDEDGDIVYYFD